MYEKFNQINMKGINYISGVEKDQGNGIGMFMCKLLFEVSICLLEFDTMAGKFFDS